jgi:transglutaminase-like putative cysteine protease
MGARSFVFNAVILLLLMGLAVHVIHLEKKLEEREKLLEAEKDALMKYKRDVEKLKFQKTQLLNEIRFVDYTINSVNLMEIPSHLKPEAAKVRAIAVQLRSPEAAYYFVRDEIAYDPFTNSSKNAEEVLEARVGNCIEKASLLASILRAQGIPKEHVYVALGTVYEDGYHPDIPPENHAWVELYYNGEWYVLDATPYLGNFSPWQWRREDYYRQHRAESYFIYNDRYTKLLVKVDPDNP